jgi:alpha-D-xyloside xylohydrolase
LEYPDDPTARELTDQFMFGPAFMVCPVTEPMYYGRHSEPIVGADEHRRVYLPEGRRWYDFWTNASYAGGQWITANAPLETLPLFVPAGSIIVTVPPVQYIGEKSKDGCEVKIYTGAKAHFELYEDDGQSYDYENGAFAKTTFDWDEADRSLTISARIGAYGPVPWVRGIRVTLISESGLLVHKLEYDGCEVVCHFR